MEWNGMEWNGKEWNGKAWQPDAHKSAPPNLELLLI